MKSLSRLLLLIAVVSCAFTLSAQAGPPDVPSSSWDPILVGNVSGDPIGNGYVVQARTIANELLAGWIISLSFLESGAVLYGEQEPGASIDCVTQTISKVTVSNEPTVFHVRFGGFQNSGTVELRLNGILAARIPVRSTDIDASGSTDLPDFAIFGDNFFNNPAAQETDFNASGSTELADLAIFGVEFFSGASGVPCI